MNLTDAQKQSTIEEILYSNGYERGEIIFAGDPGKRYARIHYWQRLSASEQAQLDTLLAEDSIDGDGTWELFFYWIK